ncbi:hypothetical protein OF83DRAFT_1087622 [Amylostereum chailletii]|nr:hypothetical protein OF83DRAFT_1087622 [Amylostereum chailletii]
MPRDHSLPLDASKPSRFIPFYKHLFPACSPSPPRVHTGTCVVPGCADIRLAHTRSATYIIIPRPRTRWTLEVDELLLDHRNTTTRLSSTSTRLLLPLATPHEDDCRQGPQAPTSPSERVDSSWTASSLSDGSAIKTSCSPRSPPSHLDLMSPTSSHSPSSRSGLKCRLKFTVVSQEQVSPVSKRLRRGSVPVVPNYTTTSYAPSSSPNERASAFTLPEISPLSSPPSSPPSTSSRLTNVLDSASTPSEATLLEAAPPEAAPLEAAPLEAAPLEATPVQPAPVQPAPAPAQPAPAQPTPAQPAPAQPAPTQPASIEATPLEAAPAEATTVTLTFDVPDRVADLSLGSNDEEPSLNIRKFPRKIKNLKESFTWFEATGIDPLTSAPSFSARVGDVFLYKHRRDSRPQTWVRAAAGGWSPIEAGGPHPRFTQYRFHLLSNGVPSWVTKKTIATYRSRDKHATA